MVSDHTFFLVRFELKASNLLGRHSTTWAIPPTIFALIILEIVFHFLPKLAWILLFYACLQCWKTDMCHHDRLSFVEIWVSQTFLFIYLFIYLLPQNCELLHSQVGGIIVVSHQHPASGHTFFLSFCRDPCPHSHTLLLKLSQIFSRFKHTLDCSAFLGLVPLPGPCPWQWTSHTIFKL
jgi:hypothetical protein